MSTVDRPNLLELVQEHSLTSVVRRELERLIFEGKIRPGERVNESDLAARFGISRGPLREALQALGEQGLVSFARNRGAYVRALSLEETEELYDLRAALDDEVGRKLAGKLTPQQSLDLESLLREMDGQVADIAAYYRNNLKFHDLLVTYAGNRRLALIHRRITNELDLFRLQSIDAGGPAASNTEHWLILRAIQTGDCDAVSHAVRNHIAHARVRMRASVGNKSDSLHGSRLDSTALVNC
jgi:DNA-binding GntR family transcriptional regulator